MASGKHFLQAPLEQFVQRRFTNTISSARTGVGASFGMGIPCKATRTTSCSTFDGERLTLSSVNLSDELK